MNAWNELQPQDPNEARLATAITLLCEVHSRKLSDEAFSHWKRRLFPLVSGTALWKALEKACDERGMPSIAWVLEHIDLLQRRDTKPFVPQPELTADERLKSARAAVLSMLWLGYTKGFGDDAIGGIVASAMGKLYQKQFETDEVGLAQTLKDAREKYPREFVVAWMKNQEAIGN